jgi:hypothetical protein
MVHEHRGTVTDSGIGDGCDGRDVVGSQVGVGRAEGRAEAGVATLIVDIPTAVVQEEEDHKDQEVDDTLLLMMWRRKKSKSNARTVYKDSSQVGP